MKRYFFMLLAVVLLLAVGTTDISGKRVMIPKLYMFGFAASFNDTIVYFTDIQTVDSAWIEKKSKFLQSRNVYASELRNFLSDEMAMPHRTCVVFYSKKRSKIEKKYLKMKHKYGRQKDGREHFDIRYITEDKFRFRSIDLTGLDEAEKAQQQEDVQQEKIAKQARKQKRKEERKERKAQKRGK